MSKKLKVGVFGGDRGYNMIEVLFNHPDAELVAVCDWYKPILDKIEKKSKELGVSVTLYDDFEKFFMHDMDAVILANYANEHSIYATRLLRSGRHVMSEVLPCETMAQAVELIEAVEESGKVYSYAENYCYMRYTFEMWRKYKEGAIGDIMYAEGEYIHDCSSIWPKITRGERNHWRNRMHANFYCTHSIGPMLMISGLRPVKVVGFEAPPAERLKEVGAYRGAGIEIITLENGAVCKSVHGDLKREPGSVNYQIYGQKGMMESGRFAPPSFFMYQESDKLCKGEWQKYNPEAVIETDASKKFMTHGGSDFYPTHFFIQKCLGREIGNEWGIDVYQAVDMGICGILGYRSVLNGNIPIDIPNLRNKEERDRFRNDNACTNPDIAKDQILPRSSFGEPDFSDDVYEKVRQIFLNGKDAE